MVRGDKNNNAMFVVLTEKIIGRISVMKKKMFSFLLTLLLVVGLMPNGVLAVETTASGTWGDNGGTWSFNSSTGTLTVSGTGEIPVFGFDCPWLHLKDSVKRVVVSEGITEIGANVFGFTYGYGQYPNLASVSLPDSLKRIDDCAFAGSSLASIYLPSKLTYIGAGAFYATNLTSVNIPASVSSIGKSERGIDHFSFDTDTLSSITVEPGNRNYEAQNGVLYTKGKTELVFFPRQNQLSSYTIPSTVREPVYLDNFYYCNNLKSITVAAGATLTLRYADAPENYELLYMNSTKRPEYSVDIIFQGETPSGVEDWYFFKTIDGTLSSISLNINGGTESTTPQISRLYPANGATNVGCTAANPPIFQVTFDREIAARGDEEYQANVNLTASQPFAIYRAEDNALVYKPTQYSGSDFLIAYTSEKSTLSVTPINRHILLDPGTEYYITMGAGFVTFADGTKSPAITKGQWSFTTEGEKEDEEELNFSIARSSISLLPGQTANPRVTLTPSDAKVSWTSSRSSVARVSSDGTITGIAPGTATITGTATLGNQKKTVTCAVTVNQNILFGWTKTAANLKVGDLESLSFTYQPADARISITSSNPSAIKVEGSQYSKGSGYTTIRAVGGGSATITAHLTAGGEEKTSVVSIYVQSDAEEIAQRFVDVALEQVGKKASDLGLSDNWCDKFVGWCAQQTGCTDIIGDDSINGITRYQDIINKGGSGTRFYNNNPRMSLGTYLTNRSDYTPQVGDIVIFTGDAGIHIDHVGIVFEVTDTSIRFVSGNYHGSGSPAWKNSVVCGSGCSKGGYTKNRNDTSIYAYARPNWSAATGITSGTRNLVSDCPVDVQVSYNGEVLDSATGQLSASFGSMTVTGEGDDRSVSLNLNDYYDVETWINGTGTGTMTFTTTSKDEDGTVGTRTYRNVPITPSTLIRVVQSGTARDAVTLEIYANGGDTVTSVWYADSDTPSVSSADSDLTEWYLSDTSEPTDSLPFTDVASNDWFYPAVQYVYENSIMNGTSATTFAPNATVERSQVVQMLYNLEGQPTVTGNSGFSDIKSGDWYSKAVIWAERTGVVDGYEDNTFRPGKSVSREEFAQMLYNYSKYKRYDLSAAADLTEFPDGSSVSNWANSAVAWANGNGLINGHDDGRLDPSGTAIRAQAASILMGFDRKYVTE